MGLFALMKTTMELPTSLLRKTKAAAAAKGQSMTAYVTSALEAKLTKEEAMEKDKPWMEFAGLMKDHPDESKKIMQTIDEECGKIRMEDWR